jgi:hypothetical protein
MEPPPPSYDKPIEVINAKGNGPIQVVTQQINIQKCSKCSNAAVDKCASGQIVLCLDHRFQLGQYGIYCKECKTTNRTSLIICWMISAIILVSISAVTLWIALKL